MEKSRKIFLFILVVACCILLVGCSTKKTSTNVTDKNTVNIQNFSFQPSNIIVKKGETVTWVNKDSATHNIKGDNFTSGSLGNGATYKNTFNVTGVFNYICSVHPSMKGTVTVE